MQNDSNVTKEYVALENYLGTKNEIVETTINVTDNNITKILSVSACFFVDNAETLVGEVNYNGTMSLNIIFEDNENCVMNLQTQTKISSKYENAGFVVDGATRIVPNIINYEIEKMGNDIAKIKTNVQLKFFNTSNQEIDVYAGGDEDIFVMQNEIPLLNYVSKNCVNLTQPIVLDSKDEIEKVLSVTAGAIVRKATTLDNILIVEGETFARALVKTKEDRPIFVALSKFDNFREEIEDGNSKKDLQVCAAANVVCEDVKTEILENNTSLEVTLPIRICYHLFDNKNVTVVTDAYSTKNEITLSTIGFNSTTMLGSESFDFRIDGNISLDEELPRIDKVLAVDGAYLTLTNVAYQNKELLVEGIVHANVIYLNDDENTINSVLIEIPFSQTERTNLDDKDVDVKLATILYDVDATAKRGREIFLDGKIKLQANFTKEVANAIISNITRGDELEQNTSAIEIYFANAGQTIWDIAKDMRVDKETLQQQNPNLPETMLGGEKVVFYNQKTLEI